MDELRRREFLQMTALAAGSLTLWGGCGEAEGPAPPIDDPGASDLPTLGGAPDTAEGRVIAALVDTVIPGKHRDPTGAPGGVDTGVPAVFFDPDMFALPLVPYIVEFLDYAARYHLGGAGFAHLSPEEREGALEQVLRDVPPLDFVVMFAKVSYLGTREAGDHLGYPGPNPGYRNHPNFSFGQAMSQEITVDGNLP